MALPVQHAPELLPGQLHAIHQAPSHPRRLRKDMRVARVMFELLPGLLQLGRMPGLLALQQSLDAGFRFL